MKMIVPAGGIELLYGGIQPGQTYIDMVDRGGIQPGQTYIDMVDRGWICNTVLRTRDGKYLVPEGTYRVEVRPHPKNTAGENWIVLKGTKIGCAAQSMLHDERISLLTDTGEPVTEL